MGAGRDGFTSLWTSLKLSYRRLPPVVKVLLGIVIGMYLLVLVLGGEAAGAKLFHFFALAPEAVLSGWVWQLFTSMFVHGRQDLFGVIFDVVILWSLGGLFGNRWRRNHFLFFYLAGGVFSGLVHVGAAMAVPAVFGHTVAGASGCSFALFAAFWMIFGEVPVSLFGSIPMKGKWVFFALSGLQLAFFLAGRNPDFALQCGGVLAGWLMVTGRWRPSKAWGWLAIRRRRFDLVRRRRKARIRVIHSHSAPA